MTGRTCQMSPAAIRQARASARGNRDGPSCSLPRSAYREVLACCQQVQKGREPRVVLCNNGEAVADAQQSAMGDHGDKTKNAGGGWLPVAVHAPLLTTALTMHFVRKHKKHNWFLMLSHTMSDFKDATQGRMLAKAYLFLHDHLPSGLTGDYAHISGSDVMNYLLGHLTEQAASRHKTTKNANAAFDDLEKWMSRGQTWKDALQRAQQDGLGDGRAPGLHSPAGILAPLIIAYPDNKFKDWIGRLRIDWMIRSRTTLDVQTDGFWKGINASNLHTCFTPEDTCATGVTHLADYDKLFGRDFVRAQKDMRPFCPEWAARFMGEPSAVESVDASSEADDPEDQLLELRRHLDTYNPELADRLARWVADKMAGESGEIFGLWVQHWVGRMDRSEHHEEQLIIRSLFLQSLHILKSLSASSLAVEDAYMLLDREDGSPRAGVQQADAARRLGKIPQYVAYTAVNARLSTLAGSQSNLASQVVKTTFAQETGFFQDIFRDPSLNVYAYKLIDLERLRTEVILQGAQAQRLADKDDQARLLEDKAITTLKLTRWQLRRLAFPGANTGSILTDCQLRVYQQLVGPGGLPFVDLSNVKPVAPVLGYEIGETIEQREALSKLFGDLVSPNGVQDICEGVTMDSIVVESDSPTSMETPEPSLPSPDESRPAKRKTPDLPNAPESSLSSHNEARPAKRKTPNPSIIPESGLNKARQAERKTSNATTTESSSPLNTETPGTSYGESQQVKRKTPNPTCNIYSGKIYRPADGSVRVPRVIDLTSDELKEDVRANVRDAVAQLTTDVQSIREDTDKQARTVSEMDARAQETLAEIATVTTRLEDMHSKVQQSVADIATVKQTLCEFRGLLAKDPEPPRPGDDGYLAGRCPAPDGWAQQVYDSMLLFAAWFYIHQCGYPQDGFGPDEVAIEATAARFPGLLQEHIHIALEHIHMQVYRRPYIVR